jgi:hypothetical protein
MPGLLCWHRVRADTVIRGSGHNQQQPAVNAAPIKSRWLRRVQSPRRKYRDQDR